MEGMSEDKKDKFLSKGLKMAQNSLKRPQHFQTLWWQWFPKCLIVSSVKLSVDSHLFLQLHEQKTCPGPKGSPIQIDAPELKIK